MNKLLLVIMLFAFVQIGYSQCVSSVQVTQSKSSADKNHGLDAHIKSNGGFEATLYQLVGIEEVVIKSVSGKNTSTVRFGDLKAGTYRVAVVFHDEEKFLCKKKVSESLIITEDK